MQRDGEGGGDGKELKERRRSYEPLLVKRGLK